LIEKEDLSAAWSFSHLPVKFLIRSELFRLVIQRGQRDDHLEMKIIEVGLGAVVFTIV
jgi:hypothetical protein